MVISSLIVILFMQTHRTYHTDLLFRHRLGLLSSELKKSIPSSTLSGWRKRDLSQIIGAGHAITDEHLQVMREFIARKKLLQAAKALWHIFQVLDSLIHSAKGFSRIIRNNKTLIVEAIKRTADVLTAQRACRLFGITTHQYHNCLPLWGKNRHGCRNSP